jgi:hypothetical protein
VAEATFGGLWSGQLKLTAIDVSFEKLSTAVFNRWLPLMQAVKDSLQR